MRLLAVTNMYPSSAHPAQGVFVAEQVKGLRAIGLQVRVLFIDRLAEGPWAYYRIGARIHEAVAEFHPDVIHCMYGGVMADQIVRRHRLRPVVVTFHGSDLLGERLARLPRRVIAAYGVYCSRRAARRADRVVLVARHLLNALRGACPPSKVRIIPCGIDLERFKPMEPDACRRQLGWDPQMFHVLFASSCGDPVKRPELARAAVKELVRRGVRAELHFLAGVANSEVPVWLNASHAFLLTSGHEGSPTIVKEALGCKVPVVSVDVGDVAERLEGMSGCYLAEPSPAGLADKLLLVRESGERPQGGERLAELSHINVAHRLRQCYEELASEAVAGAPNVFGLARPETTQRSGMAGEPQSAKAGAPSCGAASSAANGAPAIRSRLPSAGSEAISSGV
jgi:glycosyltransferase involved in cell wall biosynthesis